MILSVTSPFYSQCQGSPAFLTFRHVLQGLGDKGGEAREKAFRKKEKLLRRKGVGRHTLQEH